MRRILATNICATLHYLPVKFNDIQTISFHQLGGEEGTKHHIFLQKWVVIMYATFVANNSWPKADWVATTGLSTTQLSLLALSVTRYSETKITWQSTWATHMLKTSVFLVTSKLERVHAAIILQQKAIWGLTRKECTRKQLMSFLQNMRVVCVATAPTVRSAWAVITKSAIDFWIKIHLSHL